MDDQGYFEAVVKGRRGLVPASHLQPVYPTVSHRRRHRPLSYHVGSSPEEILSLKQDLQQCHVPNHNVPYVSSSSLLMQGRLDGSDRSSALPSLPPGGGSPNKGHTLPRSTFQTPMPDVVQSGENLNLFYNINFCSSIMQYGLFPTSRKILDAIYM